MSTLFKEAIADAKKLRALAEENARNKIMESMTPRIRALIEQELLDDLENEDVEVSIDELLPDEVPSPQPNVNINVDGEANIVLSNGDVEMENEPESEEEDLLMSLNAESARALAAIIRERSSKNLSETLDEHLEQIENRLLRLGTLIEYLTPIDKKSVLYESTRKYYIQLLKEMISLREDVILTESTANTKRVRTRYNRLVKEIKTMSKRHAETLFDRLFETRNKGGVNELDIVLDDEDLETLGVADPGAVDVTALDLDIELAGEEEAAEEVEVADEVVEAYLRELFEQDEELEFAEEEVEDSPIEDVIPVADAEAAIEDLGAALGLDLTVGVEEEEVEVGEEEVIDIDEGALRRELRRMRRLREQEEAKDADPYLDHGGEEIGDVIIDVDEEDLINALADELGDPGVDEPTVESRRRRRTLPRRRVRRVAESTRNRHAKNNRLNETRKNRDLKRRLVEYRKAVGTLKNQLTEMNLFNAKLLYVNKLMQNRNLTTKQQRAIVEALDNAKTLREAKLLYKSLTTSLNKRRPGRALTEGRNARTLGSSSRSIRSASVTKNGNEVDRWAVLAGINKD